MNEFINRTMGFGWVSPSCVNITEEPKETEKEDKFERFLF